jgi:hypothetical protein
LTIGVLAVRFIRRWGLLIGALLSGFGIFAFLTDAALVLSSPEAFFDFLLTLFTLAGLGIAFVSCLIGFIQSFRGPLAEDIAPGVQKALYGIAGVATVLVLVSLVLTALNANETVSAAEKADAAELIAKDTKWEPVQISATGGKPVHVFVKNEDPILHTFTLKDSAKGLDYDVRLGAWSE